MSENETRAYHLGYERGLKEGKELGYDMAEDEIADLHNKLEHIYDEVSDFIAKVNALREIEYE